MAEAAWTAGGPLHDESLLLSPTARHIMTAAIDVVDGARHGAPLGA